MRTNMPKYTEKHLDKNNDHDRLSFLELPGELRNCIMQHVLSPGHVWLHSGTIQGMSVAQGGFCIT